MTLEIQVGKDTFEAYTDEKGIAKVTIGNQPHGELITAYAV